MKQKTAEFLLYPVIDGKMKAVLAQGRICDTPVPHCDMKSFDYLESAVLLGRIYGCPFYVKMVTGVRRKELFFVRYLPGGILDYRSWICT